MNVRPMGDFFSELAVDWRGWEGELGRAAVRRPGRRINTKVRGTAN
jgi:hypothetical protein